MTTYMIILYITTLMVFAVGGLLMYSQNTIYSLLNFLFLVILLAIQLILLGAEFFAILYVLIYIGVVMVMFAFTLMLVNMRFESVKMYSRPEMYLTSLFFHIWFSLMLFESGA